MAAWPVAFWLCTALVTALPAAGSVEERTWDTDAGLVSRPRLDLGRAVTKRRAMVTL